MSARKPLPVGTRVYHRGQHNWACLIVGGTGVITEVIGPYNDGAYEYVVRTGEDISRRIGPDNPETRVTQWASYHTRPALTEEI